MNDTATASPRSGRLRVLLAALVSFLLVAAGAVVVPPAHAAGGSVTTAVTAASPSGVTVQVDASGLPDVAGVYAALIVTGTEDGLSGPGAGYAAFAQPFPAVSAGSTSFSFTAAAGSLDRTQSYEVLIWQQHSVPNAQTIYARGAVEITDSQWDAVFGADPTDPGTDPTDPGTDPTDPGTDPTDPGTDPTDPGTDPGTDPTDPGTDPTDPGTDPTEPATPALSVFLADGVTPVGTTALKAGDSVIVKGTGYDPAANVGGRGVPIPNTLPQGTYVVFGSFATVWQPSAGAPGAARSVGTQAWALAESVLTQVPAQYQGAIRAQWVDISADGTFQATLTLKDSPATPGAYGIYTYGAGGVVNAAQERSVPLDYRPAPTVSATVAGASAADGLTVTAAAAKLGAVTGAYVALIETGTEGDVTGSGGFAAMQFVRSVSGGAFSVDLTAAVGLLDRTKTYEVIVWQQHTMPNASTIFARAAVTITDAQWDALFPAPAPSVAVTVTDATAKDGLAVDVSASHLGSITGAYVALIEEGTESDVTAGGGFLDMAFVRSVTDGAFRADLVAAASALDRTKTYEVIVWQQHTMPGASTIYARSTVTITDAQWAALLGTTPGTPTTPTTPTAPTTPVPGGSLRWAISSSFSAYVVGGIAKGAIDVSGGATRAGGLFQFGQSAGGDYNPATGLGSVVYRGAVRFTGHGGVLDVTVANPQITVTSARAATLFVTHGGAQVPFATLDLSRAAVTTANGAVTYSSVPATLTADGRDRVLSGFTTTLDPVTFTIGSAAAAPSGTTGTVAAAAVTAKATLPATPPATTGIDIDEAELAALQAGGWATFSASGFRAGETDIKVVVYSTPVLLDTVTADADGVATWTGALPASLEDGPHTLTLQGSVSRGLEFTLTRASATIGACTVEGATLGWGYKESFRTYIEGIAKGGWTLTDVVYEYPDFVWSAGAGSFDDATLTGLVTFGGSIAFTGHGGALNTTLSNARLELAGDTGYLVFDVLGTTQDGQSVDQQGVRLAEFALGDAAPVDGMLSLDDVPTTLTEAGAAAFGTYAAGESLDPVTAHLPVAVDCGVVADDESDTEEQPTVVAAAVTPVADAASLPVWVWVVGGLVVVALAAGGGVLIARRSRANRESIEQSIEA